MEYTEQQRQAIYSLEPRICVDAGAGSGKTRVLVDRIVHLLEKDLAPLEAIVAITFTDKAAGEMKQRLRSAFRDRADVNDPEVMTRWRGLERQLEYARISTIHSFCTALLRENALRLGLDPDFRVMAESESRLLRGEVVNRVLHELIEAEDADMFHAAATLTLPQTEQMMHGLLNRRGLLHRLARRWPLDDPTKLCREWAKTATQERERRLKALKHDPKVRSFLRRLQQLTGLCQNPEDGREQRRERFIRNFLALLEAKSAQQIQRCLDEFLMKDGINGYAKHWLTPARFKEITELQTAIVKWADSLAKQEETDETLEGESAVLCCAVLRVFAQMDRAYAEDKRENAAYDFDDLIEMTVRALGDNPALRARVAGSIQFLLIDEFQDTDGVQAEIVERLAREPGGPRLFVVGDAKQSIYYFRGAELGVFQEARGAASQLLPLGQNFRSLPEILEFVNDFFRGSGLLDNLGEFLPMSTHRPRQDGQRIEFLITPGAEDGQRKIMEDCRRAEAALIAGRILELCEGNAPLPVFGRETKAFRPATFGDVAILFRSLTDAYLYEDALRRARIPYQLMQGRGFYRRQEFLDVLNLLKVVIDPWNEPALLAFLRGPFAGLSDEDLFWLTRREGLAAAFHANRLPKEMAEPAVLEQARALLHALRANMEMPLPAYLRWILEVSGFEAVLLAQFNGVQKASNVRKLVDLAIEFSRHAPASLYSFVKYLDEAREESLREGEAVLQPESAGAVLLMSIHQAKGLEFPIVFIPDMDRDQRGSNKDFLLLHRDLGVGIKVPGDDGQMTQSTITQAILARIDEEERAESARILYVAMTRARDYLALCGPQAPKPLSWFGALSELYALTDTPHDGEIVGEKWRARVVRQPAPSAVRVVSKDTEMLDKAELFCRIGPVAVAEARVFSVSQVLNALDGRGAGHDIEEPHAGLDEEIAILARTRGVLVHRLFELWDFAVGSTPSIPVLLDEAGLGLKRRASLEEELTRVAGQFRETPLFTRLCASRRIAREMPFTLAVEDVLIAGVIDAILDSDAILDYKTGRYREEQHRRYALQVRLYALAMKRLTGNAPRLGLIHYVDEDRTEEVPITPACLAEAEAALYEAVRLLRGVTPTLGERLPPVVA